MFRLKVCCGLREAHIALIVIFYLSALLASVFLVFLLTIVLKSLWSPTSGLCASLLFLLNEIKSFFFSS